MGAQIDDIPYKVSLNYTATDSNHDVTRKLIGQLFLIHILTFVHTCLSYKCNTNQLAFLGTRLFANRICLTSSSVKTVTRLYDGVKDEARTKRRRLRRERGRQLCRSGTSR